jgi:hypothetical protein
MLFVNASPAPFRSTHSARSRWLDPSDRDRGAGQAPHPGELAVSLRLSPDMGRLPCRAGPSSQDTSTRSGGQREEEPGDADPNEISCHWQEQKQATGRGVTGSALSVAGTGAGTGRKADSVAVASERSAHMAWQIASMHRKLHLFAGMGGGRRSVGPRVEEIRESFGKFGCFLGASVDFA